MQPPVQLGTLLQQRYRVTKVLGQGGFGRTYLAQDTGCFDETCVLKEFSPNDRGREALKKSRELFHREAEVLYQINHPQIPKFRANFEEQRRLFLVQEYAEGKTVAKTLSERLKQNQTFTEAEAVEFLQNMLPVLTHIHTMGIIHRDISPDNIIFRDRDRLPVLIDFGVVKAGVTQLEVSTQIHQGTTVGKAGYAPGEQLQTGEAYANSDLYALAVTVVVMMTGRKPESLIDKSTMTWKWHQWVPTLTPWFAKILNKMLSRVPNSRYQSASEVAQALRSVSDFVGSHALTGVEPNQISPATVTPQPRPNNFPINNNRQIPLSRSKRSSPINPGLYKRPKSPNPLWGILNTPWGIALGSAIAAAVFLVPLLLLGRSMMPSPKINENKTVPPVATRVDRTPVPAVTPAIQTPAPTTPTTDTSPPVTTAVTPEPVAIEAGKLTIKEGILNSTQPTVFSLNLPVGQQLKTILTTDPTGATMNIMAPNQANVDVFAKNTVNWQGTVPLAGEYRIEIVSPPGAISSRFRLEITATAPNSSPAPIAVPKVK
jgi:serine/threonine protein kinase